MLDAVAFHLSLKPVLVKVLGLRPRDEKRAALRSSRRTAPSAVPLNTPVIELGRASHRFAPVETKKAPNGQRKKSQRATPQDAKNHSARQARMSAEALAATKWQDRREAWESVKRYRRGDTRHTHLAKETNGAVLDAALDAVARVASPDLAPALPMSSRRAWRTRAARPRERPAGRRRLAESRSQ